MLVKFNHNQIVEEKSAESWQTLLSERVFLRYALLNETE